MNKKIVFTDFDDTLLNTDKSVSEKNRNALEHLLKQGHYLAYTTGRPLQGAKKLLKKNNLPTKNCYLLCFQGCFLYDLEREEVVETHPMNQEKMLKLVRFLQERDIYLEAFGKECFYCFADTEATKRYSGITDEAYQVIEDSAILRQEPIYKVMAIDFQEKETLLKLQQDMQTNTDFEFESFFSADWFYEFCGKGQNKGTGLKILAEKLQIPIEDTIAVGDEENDLSMILAAGTGCAVKNAKASVKSVADYVTCFDNNEGAVAEVIERFVFEQL